jgi:hypothetical protein
MYVLFIEREKKTKKGNKKEDVTCIEKGERKHKDTKRE